MSKVMKWNYKGKADIIYGEVKASPMPKIILVIIFSAGILAGISCFLLRNYIYDLIFNPHIELNLTKENGEYYIDLDVCKEFDKYAYIDESRTLKYDKFISENNKSYTCEVEGEINTLVCGEYPVIYKSSNRIKSQEIPVIVRISDNEDPTIALTENTKTLSCTDESIKNFNPEDYVKTATDNYYDVTVDIHVYKEDNKKEISLDDIHKMYYDISDLDTIYSGKTETAEDLTAWIDTYSKIAEKYSEIDVEPERKYIIEYTVTENNDNGRSDQTELLLIVTFDKNEIVSIINTEYDKLQSAIDDYNKAHPNNTVVKKPSNENKNTDKDNKTDNSKTDDSSSNDKKDTTYPVEQPNPWDNDATYRQCPKCHQWINSNEIDSHIANCQN